MAATAPLHLLALPILSREMADAAGELATRIDLGEFDDLDEAQLAELTELARLMANWATLAHTMEQRLAPLAIAPARPAAAVSLAICN